MITFAIKRYRNALLYAALLCVLTGMSGSCSKEENKYLADVDTTIEMSDRFVAQKEHVINELKHQYERTPDKETQYETLMEIYQSYQYFSLDSAFIYLEKAYDLSMELGDSIRIIDTRISMGFLYNFSGMLTESVDIFRSIQAERLPSDIRRHYYYLGFNLYNSLANNAINPQNKRQLESLKRTYRDSALVYCPDDIILSAEKLNDNGEPDKAISLLTENLADNLTTKEAELRYYVLSEIYEGKNDIDNQIKYLAMSSVASINSGVRQYIALTKLAELLYHRGDINRAYKYIHKSLDDAKACNSHLRILEASTVLSIIDSAVLLQKQKSKHYFIIALVFAILMLVSLVYIVFKIYRINNKLSFSQSKEKESNKQLKLLNEKLQESNKQLSLLNNELIATQSKQETLNKQLHESNKVKTEYITRFMNLCLEYIGKMEQYRTHLSKVAAKKNLEALCDTIQSSRYITMEVADFYKNFDEAFLNIHPTFIEDINSLLVEEERIGLKEKGRLKMELRICALIKLGITDVGKIQRFLRCSASTVYNYKSNMRNKAINKETFEEDIANL